LGGTLGFAPDALINPEGDGVGIVAIGVDDYPWLVTYSSSAGVDYLRLA
jgi:hypothetical protein